MGVRVGVDGRKSVWVASCPLLCKTGSFLQSRAKLVCFRGLVSLVVDCTEQRVWLLDVFTDAHAVY